MVIVTAVVTELLVRLTTMKKRVPVWERIRIGAFHIDAKKGYILRAWCTNCLFWVFLLTKIVHIFSSFRALEWLSSWAYVISRVVDFSNTVFQPEHRDLYEVHSNHCAPESECVCGRKRQVIIPSKIYSITLIISEKLQSQCCNSNIGNYYCTWISFIVKKTSVF